MRISPINQSYTRPCDTSSTMRPQYDGKNVSHKAVNQKYLKEAMKEYQRRYPRQDQCHLLTMLNIEIAYGFISLQDGIDTFEAIKPYAENSIDFIDSSIDKLREAIRNRALKK